MSLAIIFHFLCAQHVSDINISIIRSFRLFCSITTLVVLFLVRCVLEFRCGWVEACTRTPLQPNHTAQINRRTVVHNCIFILSFIVQDVLHVSAFSWILFSLAFLCLGLVRAFWKKNSKPLTGSGLRKRWLQIFDGLAVCAGLPTFGKWYY